MNRTRLHLQTEGIAITGECWPLVRQPAADDHPLVVAIHGGTYTHKYFDIEGCSLLARASDLGIPIAAVDRPCYGGSEALKPEDATILRSAEVLNAAMPQLWKEQGGNARGIFLVGHSIGGAVAVLMASMASEWPLLGIAISGIGMKSPDAVINQWRSLPPEPTIPLPPDLKDMLMFGPEGTFLDKARVNAHAADHGAPRQELQDIVFKWLDLLAGAAPQVGVPLHYRQPEFDRLWIVDEVQVRAFGSLFTASPSVDAELLRSSGHCIDFHRVGAAFQLQQLAFAMRCSVT
jgi:pimeloyl-ACP methyl ester carboxylesterase